MKKIALLLALSSVSIFGADPALRQFSLATTNGEAVLAEDVFTRNGETNLIRNTVLRNGVLESRCHKFYQSGLLVGEHWTCPDSSGFITEANLPYTLIFKSGPSNTVSFAYICSEDRTVIDYFMATNGIFYPVDTCSVQAARKLTTEMQKPVSH